jgi:prolyl oligopeptidase family protein
MRIVPTPVLLLFLTVNIFAQAPVAKKQLSHEELVTWKQIQNSQISHDGLWVSYSLKAEEGGAMLKVWNAQTNETFSFDRGESARFSADSKFLVFEIKPFEDSLKAQKRRKVSKDEMPQDTLAILDLSDLSLVKIPDVKSFSLPEKWDGWLVYRKEAEREKKEEPAPDSTNVVEIDSTQVAAVPDSLQTPKEKKKKPKKESNKTGTKLVLRELATGTEEVVPFVKNFQLAEEGPRVLITSTGDDSTFLEGVYLFDCGARVLKPMFRQKGEYKQLSFDEKGTQLAFLANLDTMEAQIPPFGLLFWAEGQDSARLIADTSSAFLPEHWLVSEYARPVFSKDGSKMFLGMAPPPILQDTNLLDEEIVNVEVWSYTDGRLHTNQKTLVDREKKRSYDVVWHITENEFVPLASEDMPEMSFGDERNADVALGYTGEPYLQLISWEGSARKDLSLVDVKTGERKEIIKGLRGNARLSPSANYAWWYSELDSAWFAWSVKTGVLAQVTTNSLHPFYNELNDVPNYPRSYGLAAWTKGDRHILIYDRYDIWQIDPAGKTAPVNLTNGRESRIVYRYIRLDPEKRFVEPGERLLLHIFDEKTKASGYGFLLLGAGQPIQLVKENFAFARRPQKAKDAERLLFTKENFQTFPDLLYSDFTFQNIKRVSDANPQQTEYAWGTMELYEWTSLDGQRLQGLLAKPENFDPKKKYPMIVNFYERSSDRLNRYHRPYPGRSTINYAFYVSQGYLIFNPDVPYRTGYPGESCYNAVVPGVTSLIDKGFVDKDRIGVQGHSWGGYQIAHLITKTDLFRCAESGAPVVNMFSAYGGIRWGTGLSRMFQYEHTQSRIGGTIWEYPLRYLENSPLFFLDKVNTPVLIMHNDADGHVPWYQGIEFFTAMRRLGKPAWLLNYNGEPHWPVKLQNRKDFQFRMSQFFDYYLKDAPMPQWMERGVPAVEKGILQGLEVGGK